MEISNALFKEKGLELHMLRLDEMHGGIGGNKWYKLKYNLSEFRKQEKKALLTFGGAYSNHIAATAAAGFLFGFRTIGIIRGEKHHTLNPTLRLAREQGMELHYADRQLYRNKDELMAWVSSHFGEDIYILPEGGSNDLGVKGCMEILDTVDWNPDLVCCACGTGATLTGLAMSAKGKGRCAGFSALKGGDFLRDSLEQLAGKAVAGQTRLVTEYHFGGYAKQTPDLLDFIDRFWKEHGILLDPVYTGKMMYGIYDQATKGHFKEGEKILAIHTGGLQGIGSKP
jgi:1-aminocyclopropane-1-carboxylate deaminase/D-cysteine desulfhydrase-like pyridoxal-dependent ACC family enzyme